MAKRNTAPLSITRSLRTLVEDKRASICEENVACINAAAYTRWISYLSKYKFWEFESQGIRPLYEHQRAALSLGVAYLAAEAQLIAESGVPEAALIKMPTGSGKSGIVAVLARCLPEVRRVLVLTPRTALSDQLRKDVRWRFWQHLGLDAQEGTTYVASAAQIGAPVEDAAIVELLPSTTEQLTPHASGRLIAVGTFHALQQIYREAEEAGSDTSKLAQRRSLQLLSAFDLIVVDEGHYEPAPAWSRAVRELARPTLLLSATPYRNDYKSFRVRGRFVFNYSFDDAVADKTIREPNFTCGVRAGARSSADDIKRFVDLLKETLPGILQKARAYTKHPKVIVRADDYKKMLLLQGAIAKVFKTRPIVIHHQVRGTEIELRRFHSVRSAREVADSSTTVFWLHEAKLLEGIDDPSVVAVAIYDRFTNARQLVQQVGRALRTTDKSRGSLQQAWVLSVKENHDIMKASWLRYLAFERYAAKDPQNLVQAESALPDMLLERMPEVQYLNGDFRPRFAAGNEQQAEDFRVPASAAVFEISATFDWTAIAKRVEEALLAEDRFKPLRIAGMPTDTLAYAYYGWRSSPFLALQYFPEWTLGLCVLVRAGHLLLIQDTGGIVLTEEGLGVRRADRTALARLMPSEKDGGDVRISRIATFSLDVSERAIRSIALRTRSLGDTFGDLLDPVLVPTTTFGYVAGRGRYLGLTRARVTDSYPEPLPLPDFCAWARSRATELCDQQRAHNPVFDRYAAVRGRLTALEATPISILIDVDDTFTEYSYKEDADAASKALRDVKYDDLCSDVDQQGNFEITLDDKIYPCQITFNEERQRYSISSDALDEAMTAKSIDAGATAVPITAHLNREQSFRIIVQNRRVIYAHRRFFEPNTDYIRSNGDIPLLAEVHRIPAFDAITSEKGEEFYATQRETWRRQSLFGVVHKICQPRTTQQAMWDRLYDDLRSFDTVVCDDDSAEVGDFLAIDEGGKRIAIIHAKRAASASHMSVGALQVVGRQVLASLAFCSAVARAPKIEAGRWGTNVMANTVELDLSRIFRNTRRRNVAAIEALAARALEDRSWRREIWILAGKLMTRAEVVTAIGNDSNRARQFLMYLDSLVTGCARANSTLRIYCN